VPLAATLKVAVCPAVTLRLAGCDVIVGATVDDALGVTVNVAGVLVAVPIVLVTTTLNCAELSEVVTGGVTNVEDVPPLTGEPFFLHWNPIGDEPVAATVKVALWPTGTVLLVGCDVICGAVTVPAETVSFTGTESGEFATPEALITT